MLKNPGTKYLDRKGFWKPVPGKNDQRFSAASLDKNSPLQCTEYVCTCVYLRYQKSAVIRAARIYISKHDNYDLKFKRVGLPFSPCIPLFCVCWLTHRHSSQQLMWTLSNFWLASKSQTSEPWFKINKSSLSNKPSLCFIVTFFKFINCISDLSLQSFKSTCNGTTRCKYNTKTRISKQFLLIFFVHVHKFHVWSKLQYFTGSRLRSA